ncbi:cobalamin biosynthesis protein [Streptomyces sp. RPT161]|uniref:cobalamin biosynthesis protein n=1 Tax=Streptomyces sp. RPT161 TaxID=3015993 RepID=UPI003FCE4261
MTGHRVVVGVGASSGAPADEVYEVIESVLAEAGLAAERVAALATVAAKADEPGIVEAARRLGGVPVLAYDAAVLAAIAVPSPSPAALATVGTPSVAEAAALAAAPGGELLVRKRKSTPRAERPPTATAALASRPRG